MRILVVKRDPGLLPVSSQTRWFDEYDRRFPYSSGSMASSSARDFLTEQTLENHRINPKTSVVVEELSVENKTGNSIIIRYDPMKKRLQVVDCCLEEQGK